MIAVVIGGRRSIRALADYVLHDQATAADPRPATSERVEWTACLGVPMTDPQTDGALHAGSGCRRRHPQVARRRPGERAELSNSYEHVVLSWPEGAKPLSRGACPRQRAGRARRARPRRPAPGHRGRARRHGQPLRARARLARRPGNGTGREGDQARGPAVAALGRGLRAPHGRRGHRQPRAAPAGAGGVHDRGGRPEGGGRSREGRRRRRPREQPPATAATAQRAPQRWPPDAHRDRAGRVAGTERAPARTARPAPGPGQGRADPVGAAPPWRSACYGRWLPRLPIGDSCKALLHNTLRDFQRLIPLTASPVPGWTSAANPHRLWTGGNRTPALLGTADQRETHRVVHPVHRLAGGQRVRGTIPP